MTLPARRRFTAISSAALAAALLVGGCGKSESAPPSGSTATTQASAEMKTPVIGRPVDTLADYKPVAGTPGGRIVRDSLGEPKSFNPITAGETSTTEFTNRMFEGLTRENPFTGEIEPFLAESYSVADDKVTWTFKLRTDVVFNDGTPMAADDVVFSWNDLVYDMSRPDPSKPPRWPCSTRDVTTFDGKPLMISKVDDHTVKVVTPFPIAILPRLMGAEVLSKEKYQGLVADGSFGAALSANSTAADLVGTGPFILDSYSAGRDVRLKRNPKYWRKGADGKPLPYLDALVFQIVKDTNATLLDFKQQITDYYVLRSGADVPELRPLEKKDNFSFYTLGPDFGETFVAFNMNQAAVDKGHVPQWKIDIFRNVKFRQAVSYAVDREALVKNVYRNLAQPLAAPFTSAPTPFTVTDVKPYPHDVAKAKALLAEIGLTDRNGDGVLEDAGGHELSITMVTNSGNVQREQMLDFVRKDLERVGIKVNILLLEFNLLVDKMDSSYDWEGMVMGFTGGREPNDGANIWKSSGRLHLWWPDQDKPHTEWEAEIDQIFLKGIRELDHEKRKALYKRWIEIVAREQPLIYLVNQLQVVTLRNRFGNVFPAPVGLLHNEEEVFVKSGDAKATP